MAMGMTHTGSAITEIKVSFGSCQNNRPSTPTSMTGSRTMTEVALLKKTCSDWVSFITREISWPVEFSVKKPADRFSRCENNFVRKSATARDAVHNKK